MQIVIFIYDGLTALDAVGPYEILSRLPKAEVKFVSTKKGVVLSDTHFLKLVADYDISEIDRADILLIPGSTAGFIRELKNKKLLKWITGIHKSSRFTTSVCTGSVILAAAGLLDGLRATTHWAVMNLLRDYGAIPAAERYTQNGKIITAAGVSAGIDMSLFLVEQILGTEKAKAYELLVEYDPQPPFHSGSYHKADENTINLAADILKRDLKKDLSLVDLALNLPVLLKLNAWLNGY